MDIDLVHMTSEELGQSLKSAQFEQSYERALRQVERICEEERVRVLRVQLLLLEDRRYDLQEQVGDNDKQWEILEDSHDELRQQLIDTESALQQAQTELKARIREMQRYKAEAQALSATISDNTKVLTEKLTLARELANLKPELEHLRSQVSTQQNNLAEKLALQRELSALQVELETERRTVQRIKSSEKSSDNDSSLAAQIEELKKELAKEKRETQKKERENRKKLMEWESQKDVLESKLEAFRTKLRSTKEQLKEAQDELEKTQTAHFKKSAELTTARVAGANPKKRPVPHFDPDMTIGTPGNGRPRANRARNGAPAEVAATASFSITPFLNRTLSILPESPSQLEKTEEEMNKTIDKIAAEADQCSPTVKEKGKLLKKALAEPTRRAKSAQPLKESTNPKANVVTQKPRLAKFVEEEDTENEPSKEIPVDEVLDKAVKRQKVLGQKITGQKKSSIFDSGDDGEPGKGKRKLGLGLRGGEGNSFGDLSFRGQGRTLTAFSPLKKDRKAAAGA
jgi:chromosome segregation ATPase